MTRISTKFAGLSTIVAAGLFSVSAAASDAPTFSLSPASGKGDAGKSISALGRDGGSNNQYVVDFVPGDEPVAGVNFDVVFQGAAKGLNVNFSGCGSFVTRSHSARCEMVAPDRMRVLVFSAPVQSLPATTLVEFQIEGKFKGVSIDTDSVAVSDFSGSKIAPEVL